MTTSTTACSPARAGWPLNQWVFVLVGDCPASLILRRLFGLRSLSEGR